MGRYVEDLQFNRGHESRTVRHPFWSSTRGEDSYTTLFPEVLVHRQTCCHKCLFTIKGTRRFSKDTSFSSEIEIDTGLDLVVNKRMGIKRHSRDTSDDEERKGESSEDLCGISG